MERTVLFCEDREIRAFDLGLDGPEGEDAPVSGEGGPGTHPDGTLFPVDTFNLDQLERKAIEAALDQCGWVQKKAAGLLGLSESQMTYRLNKFSISNPNFRARHRRSEPN